MADGDHHRRQSRRRAARRIRHRPADTLSEHSFPSAVHVAQIGLGLQAPQRDGRQSDRSRRRDALAAQRHPAGDGGGAAQEPPRLGGGSVRRDPPGVRHTRSPQLRLSTSGAPSARLLHPDEGGADFVARDQRYVRDAPDPDADRDAIAAKRIAGRRLHRDLVQHLVEAVADRDDNPAAARLLAAADAQAAAPRQSAPRQRPRRDDERSPGDDQRHSAGEGFRHRELRGVEVRRGQQQVRAQQPQAHAPGAGGAAGNGNNRDPDRGAGALGWRLAGAAQWDDDRRHAARLSYSRLAPAAAAEAAVTDAHDRAIVAGVGGKAFRDPRFPGRVPARYRDARQSDLRARAAVR